MCSEYNGDFDSEYKNNRACEQNGDCDCEQDGDFDSEFIGDCEQNGVCHSQHYVDNLNRPADISMVSIIMVVTFMLTVTDDSHVQDNQVYNHV